MKVTASFIVAVLADLALAHWDIGQAVNTTSGTVIGHAAKLDTTVSEYLGIPWAAPPVGKLRWVPAQPYSPSATAIKANAFGPDCPQSSSMATTPKSLTAGQAKILSNLASGKNQSEDCLTLNIWTQPQIGQKKKAVLVWIYGGGFATGSTSSPAYNGVRFAGDQDVVLVSINYRLNILGFPASPTLFDDVNLGLLDQRKALEWIRDNIAAFGGDPKRITLFGESAGSRGVDLYAYAWANAKDPIVNGFITESGAAPTDAGWKPNPKSWFELSGRLNCGAQSEGKKTIDCMRTKSVNEIMAALGSDGGKRKDIRGAFTPVVDGKTYFDDYDKRAAAGQFIQKPLFTGNNDNEAGLQDVMGAKPLSDVEKKQTNLGYACGAKTAAERRRAKSVPVWRYRFMASFPNQKLTATSGAWHASEISSVFGLIEDLPGDGPTVTQQISLSRYMNYMWAEFAKDPANGLTKYDLPQWSPEGENLILLGGENGKDGPSFSGSGKYDADCSTLKSILPGVYEE